MKPQVIIIGAGLSGLTAANQLLKNQIDFLILEGSDRIGGRVKTDTLGGYKLDYGFQVLLTAYPEAKHWLNYKDLNLKNFSAGAQLLFPNGTKGIIGDPLRDLSSLFPTLFSKAGNLGDKIKILQLKNKLNRLSIEEIFKQKETTTLDALKSEYGFSDKIINSFFKPFYSGIFLEKELSTSRRMFDFVFKMFGEGNAAVPNLGMEEIPKQLASNLPKDSILLNAKVSEIKNQQVILEDGSAFEAPHIIVATEATGLVSQLSKVKKKYHSTTHLHFVASNNPFSKPIIGLNTKEKRLVNNICSISQVAPGYAPNGENLISISVVGENGLTQKELIMAVKKELQLWFGKETQTWEFLHHRKVGYALPNQTNIVNSINKNNYEIKQGLYACGDHFLNGSINAAMKSGKEVAEFVAKKL